MVLILKLKQQQQQQQRYFTRIFFALLLTSPPPLSKHLSSLNSWNRLEEEKEELRKRSSFENKQLLLSFLSLPCCQPHPFLGVTDHGGNKDSGTGLPGSETQAPLVVSLGKLFYLSMPQSWCVKCKKWQYMCPRLVMRILDLLTPLQYSCLENPMDGGAW